MPADPASAEPQSWLVYALGSGLGHLVRAESLRRAAERRGHRVEVLATSAQARALPLDVTWLNTSDGPGAIAEQVRRVVLRGSCDVVVVDTFPRGLVGELADVLPGLSCPKVLVHRDISPAYWHRFGLEQFIQAYDLVLLPGERGPLQRHSRLAWTPRWLVRDSGELLPREAARSRLGVATGDERPLLVVSASGTEAEVRAARELVRRLEARFPRAVVRETTPGPGWLWPLLEALPGVDVLVGAGGYNTVHEARCTGTPFVALPRARLYDRQASRLADVERAGDEAQLLERVEQILAAPNRRDPPEYRNGAHEAARLIEEVAAGRSRLSPPPTS